MIPLRVASGSPCPLAKRVPAASSAATPLPALRKGWRAKQGIKVVSALLRREPIATSVAKRTGKF